MAKQVLYKYNPETDNFERYYPSFRVRLASWCKIFGFAILISVCILILAFYCFDSPTEENLRSENNQLKQQLSVFNKRLENSMKVLYHIQDRDNNFYRVMMQMDPMTPNQRLSGLENDYRYNELRNLNDASLLTRLSRSLDVMERQLYAQVQSFDQLREELKDQKNKMLHVPSILPLRKNSFTLASGFGYRRDPVKGAEIYHEGIDLSAPFGTDVVATADGIVSVAKRVMGYGNCVEIDHGYNYMSRYGNLSEILINEGDSIKRGQVIGKLGSSGKSIGPHLHYEVRFRDEPQNPVNYCFMDLSPEEYSDMIQYAENAGYVMD